MIIRIGYDIVFNLPSPAPMVLMLHVFPSLGARLKTPEFLSIEPNLPLELYLDRFGNQCSRISAPLGDLRLAYDNRIELPDEPEPAFPDARQHPVEELPFGTLEFLLPSRYCESDRLADIAWALFNESPPGWSRVQAVCDWVFANVEFGYEYARPSKTAWDVYQERRGVCRDFMHLALTFCRCLNIPARYATGYLGDIGVPPDGLDMDFSAFFEVFLEGSWHPFDARHNVRRVGRVKMGQGRDAADVALTTTFGVSNLVSFKVVTDEEKNLSWRTR